MAILVFSPNGTYVTKPTLEAARTSADCAGKTVVVTTALTAAQSAIAAAWPADRALRVEKSGMRERVSVLDFGADPTGVTDSTAAIQAAINYLASTVTWDSLFPTGGGTVFFPTGKYLIGPAGIGYIQADMTNILLQGAGVGATSIMAATSTSATIPIINSIRNTGLDRVVNFEIRDLYIQGNFLVDVVRMNNGMQNKIDNAVVRHGIAGIRISGGNLYSLRNVYANECTNGFHCESVVYADFGWQDVSMFKCISNGNSAHGFYFAYGADANLINCFSSGNTGKGFYFYRDTVNHPTGVLEEININSCASDQNTENGFLFIGARWFTLNSCWSSNGVNAIADTKDGFSFYQCNWGSLSNIKSFWNRGDGIQLYQSADIAITNAWVAGNKNTGVRVKDSSNCKISNISGTAYGSSFIQEYGLLIEGSSLGCMHSNISVSAASIANISVVNASADLQTIVGKAVPVDRWFSKDISVATDNTLATVMYVNIGNVSQTGVIIFDWVINSNAVSLFRSGQLRISIARQVGSAATYAQDSPIATIDVVAAGTETFTATWSVSVVVGGVTATNTLGINVQVALGTATNVPIFIRGNGRVISADPHNSPAYSSANLVVV